MNTHRLIFDSAQSVDRTRYQFLYMAWNKFAASTGDGAERGPIVVDFNTRLLDALDEASAPTALERWPGFLLDLHGFTARTLHAGAQTVTLSLIQLQRLTKAAELMAVQVDVVTQARVFRDLFAFLSSAKESA